jgi:hypothetical protein
MATTAHASAEPIVVYSGTPKNVFGPRVNCSQFPRTTRTMTSRLSVAIAAAAPDIRTNTTPTIRANSDATATAMSVAGTKPMCAWRMKPGASGIREVSSLVFGGVVSSADV